MNEQNNMKLKFRHLYDAHWGVFHVDSYGRKWVIFPQDFQPYTGKEYDCIIQWTWTGNFTYNKENYRVARAHLKDKGTIIDEIDYKWDKKEKLESPLAEAFKKIKLK